MSITTKGTMCLNNASIGFLKSCKKLIQAKADSRLDEVVLKAYQLRDIRLTARKRLRSIKGKGIPAANATCSTRRRWNIGFFWAWLNHHTKCYHQVECVQKLFSIQHQKLYIKVKDLDDCKCHPSKIPLSQRWDITQFEASVVGIEDWSWR